MLAGVDPLGYLIDVFYKLADCCPATASASCSR